MTYRGDGPSLPELDAYGDYRPWDDIESEQRLADDDPSDRCIDCGADIGHYNGCISDPDAMCLCHLCMDDQAVTSEEECPFHGRRS
jgi:hypothetical protein